MRLILAVLLASAAVPSWAETIAATSRVTAVTIFPQGAQVTREVAFEAPAGTHDLLITDLPGATVPDLLRIAPADGVQVGAFALREDRLPPRDLPLTPAQQAAKAAVEAAEAAVRSAQAGASAVRARIEAAEAQVAFLRGVGGQMPDGSTPEDLQAIARMVGAEVLAARQTALAAEAELFAATQTVADAEKDLADAMAAQAALASGDADYTALSVAVTVAGAGPGRLTLTHFVYDASWRPVYDINLTRAGAPALSIARGVLVTQRSGEDWAGVGLTLSTAQPSEQAEPSPLWPELRRITDPEEVRLMAKGGAPAMADMGLAEPVAEPVMEAEVVAEAATEGDVVVYRYPTPVDVATGVEDLRLALDQVALTPAVEARAVPRMDRTAFVMATFTNTSGEVLLPGNAYLLREGVLVGGAWFEGAAAGEEAELAFGAIEALRLRRDMPNRAEGDRGLISKSTQIEEEAVLVVENLGDEVWPVRLIDQVPYSEQEDLEITFAADPAPAETDVDGNRGVLAWEFDLAPGETREVRLSHRMRWPEGMELQ